MYLLGRAEVGMEVNLARRGTKRSLRRLVMLLIAAESRRRRAAGNALLRSEIARDLQGMLPAPRDDVVR